MSDILDCPDCDGTGEQHIGPLTLACRFCGGKGYVGGDNEPAEDTPPPDKAPAVWEDPDTRDFPGCRVCLGAGRVVSIGAGGMVESPCPRCAPDSAFRTG